MTAKSQLQQLWQFHGGVHPLQHKTESTARPIRKAEMPKQLILPLHQHIGEPAEVMVKPGEKVLKGQMIARANGYVSAPVHAPTSGIVRDIGVYPIPHPSGLSADCIVIDSDGEDRWGERQPLPNYTAVEPSELRNFIREAGIVGLGGAGFPSYIKLNPGHRKAINTLILNGVECEPYITCDDMLMRERPEEIIGGLQIIRHALQAEECIIAVEDNKPTALSALRQAAEGMDNVVIVQVPTLYPQGSEKQLVKVLTGKEVPSDKLTLSIGVVTSNVGTAAAVFRAVHHGEPLISRVTTITGAAIRTPRNLETLIGTPMRDLIRQCEGDLSEIKRLVMGGPMMGFSLAHADIPVIKTTNCVLATAADDLPKSPIIMPCIRCGACADSCPINLLPQQLYWYARNKDLEQVQEYNLFDCIECGCCSYVCPSNIPLVQYFRYAKGDIWIKEREKEKADLARRRHESRQDRLEREKAEREARRQQAKEQAGESKKKAEIEAAMARAEDRRQQAMAQAEARRTVTAEPLVPGDPPEKRQE